jgi:hypothetical protein
MMIRIEGDHRNLKEIHQLIYQADPSIEIDEDYKSTPGMQREPVLIGLIGAASPVVIACIRAWVSDRKNKRDTELLKTKIDVEREKIRMAYDLEKTKLMLEEDHRKIIEINAEEVEELTKFLPGQKDDKE